MHPVVIRHPDTSRKALYVNPGVHRCASMAGPRRKLDRCSTISSIMRCGPNSPAAFSGGKGRWPFWDNRSTWHFAVND